MNQTILDLSLQITLLMQELQLKEQKIQELQQENENLKRSVGE